ncbi:MULTISPECIES: CaiB/BaiF CoA transferase family protein [unclassified Brevibacterium]|uniref:CaiB/BaiF CoA transferase family protein n=1 Tax=unclassified Brevibacterium TaxID=2614124 RepID=UPI001092D992|nr:CoA transferase [Brevibacterium sp. S22]TGD30162.1 CoA transferase [Brevibacterium sp. S22]
MNATKKLLSGVRVVDFSRVLAGPYATAMLADQGAEVIKVEMPGHGDDSRHLGPFTDSGSTYFTGLNRGKRSIEADLKDPEHHARLLDLIAEADVVVENFRPGVAAKLGLSYEDAKAVKPDIVYASISGFGQHGAQAGRPAYDTVIQALSGLMASTGFPEGSPTRIGESIADVSAGVFAAFGISTALFHRQTTGEGTHLDIPMLDVMLAMQPTNASLHAAGSAPARVGNRHPVSAPFDTYRAADGLIVIAVANDRLFGTLAATLGKPELATDPRFATDGQRSDNDEVLRVEIEEFTTGRTVDELCAIFDAAGVPNSPVLDFDEAVDGPIGSGRGLTATDPRTGHAYLGHPLLVDGARPASTLPAPHLGEHNADFAPADTASH